MTSPVLLITGLGNPGDRYARTRHNVGQTFVASAARDHGVTLRYEPKFEGDLGGAHIGQHQVWLFTPGTYMNESGRPVASVARFYKIPIEQILVVHDELELPPGSIRAKQGGGHGGHNGLRDITKHMTANFQRLRIGIGRPATKSPDDVANYVLRNPSKEESRKIEAAMHEATRELDGLIAGNSTLDIKV